MRYIYYVVAIVVVVSALAVYGVFDTRVEISKPLFSVNDRIISEDEFERLLERKPSYMGREQFIDSVIEKQLLIQEAIRQEINHEENFRQSVENFYEQSLIKILLDRKQKNLVVDVTDAELEKYEMLLGKKMQITKITYQSIDDAHKGVNGKKQEIEAEFIDLSDDLKFIILFMDEGQASEPQSTDFGYYVCVLDKIMPSDNPNAVTEFDMRRVSLFLQDKKKEQITADWIASIREQAKIWRK